MIEKEEYIQLATMCANYMNILQNMHPPIDWELVEYYDKLREKLLNEAYN